MNKNGIKRGGARESSEAGYTLLELLVVLAILALIAGLAVPQVLKSFGRAKSDTVRVQVNALASNLEFYKFDVGQYPTQQQGLQALVAAPANIKNWNGPYVTKEKTLVDPWGRPYLYKFPGEHGEFDIYSLGADGEAGGEGEAQDVGNWQ